MNQELKDYVELSKKQPKELHFESSSRCNARCITCPREGMTRYQGEMSHNLFVKGIQEASDAAWVLDYVHFHLNGEPLYLPIDDLVWRINYARESLRGNPVLCFFTNASLLTEEVTEVLLASKLDKIVFSVDGGNKYDFEKNRVGLNWEQVIGNIRYFMRRKFESGSKISTQTAFIPTWENRNSLPEYYKVFQGMGIEDVGGSGVNNIGGHIDSKKLRLPTQYTKGNIKSPCWRIFLDLSICADGKAVICCQDVRGECVVGDLNTQTLPEIWNGEVFSNIRKVHLEMQQEQISFCANCDYMECFVSPEWWPK